MDAISDRETVVRALPKVKTLADRPVPCNPFKSSTFPITGEPIGNSDAGRPPNDTKRTYSILSAGSLVADADDDDDDVTEPTNQAHDGETGLGYHRSQEYCSEDSETPEYNMSTGSAFIILNILRVLTVMSLILVCVCSVLTITAQMSHFTTYFFSIVSSSFRIISCLLLITTEAPTAATTRFYQKRCPVFTQGYSLAWTGVPMITFACAVLSDTKMSKTSSDSKLAAVYHSMSLTAGISIGLLGLIYCLMPLIYWKAKSGECRRLRRDGASTPADSLTITAAKYDPTLPTAKLQSGDGKSFVKSFFSRAREDNAARPEMNISGPIIGTERGGSSSQVSSASLLGSPLTMIQSPATSISRWSDNEKPDLHWTADAKKKPFVRSFESV